jgi:RNA polymerase II subunit A-like phosphatase
VVDTISSKVTHVVAARVCPSYNYFGIKQTLNIYEQSRTAKVRSATRYPSIKIVTPNWLYDSISHWRHEPEEPYLIEIHPEDRHPKVNGFDEGGPLLSSEDEESEDEEDEDFDNEPVDTSNVGWKDVDEEFAEFFGDELDELDDEEESETESIRSERTEVVEVGKRKRGENASVADSEGDTDMEESLLPSESGSRLAKRQRVARERAAAGSSLRDVEVSFNEDAEAEDSDSLADELERELLGLDDGDDAEEGGGDEAEGEGAGEDEAEGEVEVEGEGEEGGG